jgi:Amino acid synthesis
LDWVRKIVFVEERVLAEAGKAVAKPITRVAGIAVIQNPFAGQGYVEDLASLFDVGAKLGEALMPDVVRRLPNPATSYGKAAIVGVNGDFEHGGALIHPKLGKPMRAAVGGGDAIISSNVKVAPAGSAIDVPLAHKDDIWSFDHFDTMTVMVADAPRPDEIMVVMIAADGGRPAPRVGKGRIL